MARFLSLLGGVFPIGVLQIWKIAVLVEASTPFRVGIILVLLGEDVKVTKLTTERSEESLEICHYARTFAPRIFG